MIDTYGRRRKKNEIHVLTISNYNIQRPAHLFMKKNLH